MNDNALGGLMNTLERLIHLQNIALDFSWYSENSFPFIRLFLSSCSISDIGVQQMSQALDKLISLKYVTLAFIW